MRLNRYLASCGLGSRRSCEKLISEGKIAVNGKVCRTLATQVGEDDVVEYNTRAVTPRRTVVVLLNKPAGFTTTQSDESNRRTIYDLLPPEWKYLGYAGRLDRESEGLLILTNDGELAQQITHPRHALEKEYEVILEKPFKRELKKRLLEGFPIEDGFAKMEEVEFLTRKHVRVILKQGLKRQIRQMFETMGCPVERLFRIRIGNLTVGNLAEGKWRVLSDDQIQAFRKQFVGSD